VLQRSVSYRFYSMYQQLINVFENDDAGYEEWVAANWGYSPHPERPKGEYILHLRDCTHLRRNGTIIHVTSGPTGFASSNHDVPSCEV